jgi:hypothetical protein
VGLQFREEGSFVQSRRLLEEEKTISIIRNIFAKLNDSFKV